MRSLFCVVLFILIPKLFMAQKLWNIGMGYNTASLNHNSVYYLKWTPSLNTKIIRQDIGLIISYKNHDLILNTGMRDVRLSIIKYDKHYYQFDYSVNYRYNYFNYKFLHLFLDAEVYYQYQLPLYNVKITFPYPQPYSTIAHEEYYIFFANNTSFLIDAGIKLNIIKNLYLTGGAGLGKSTSNQISYSTCYHASLEYYLHK